MANQEHLNILKQGVKAWNRWRKENPDIEVDLRGANLSEANLSAADLREADLRGADLREADLIGVDLSEADLRWADLIGADLSGAMIWVTTFAGVDLSQVKGLETIIHLGPSFIDIHTLYRSQGQIPEAFLRGCGIDDTFIEYIRALTVQPIQYYSCFISYSHQDEEFARHLHAYLQQNNARCWYTPEDMKVGDRIRDRIDEAIRIHDKLLLVLSQHSVASQWVADEVEHALALERKRAEPVLFPIRLDEAIMESEVGWAGTIKRGRHIGDFSHWKNHDAYQKAFKRLLRDLKAGE